MIKLLLILLLITTSIVSSTIEEAKILFDNKQYKKSLAIFQEFKDNSEAQYYLGESYLYGLGVERDEVSALMYFNQSAKLHNPFAMANIARLYLDGKFVAKDINKSIEWFEKSVRYGNNIGYLSIGDIYYRNFQDSKALEYYVLFSTKKDTTKSIDFNERIALLYLKQKDYSNAYKHFLIATQLGSYRYTFNLFNIIKNNITLSAKKEAITWLQKASNANYNKTKSLALSQRLLYGYYIYDSHEYEKAEHLAIDAYLQGNNQMGCDLASEYSSLLTDEDEVNPNLNLQKAYEITSEIIQKVPNDKNISTCYITLSQMYRNGHYIAQDVNKSISLLVKSFGFKLLQDSLSIEIAELYLTKLKDYKNARKWYKIAYELTKDTKYITIVDEYIKSQSKFIDSKNSKDLQDIFPTINNIINKEQIIAILESKDYYFLSTSQKSICIYDKKTLKLKRELRGWVGNGTDGLVKHMAFDEGKRLLYCTSLDSSVDISKNNIIKVFDIDSGKVVKIIDNKRAMGTTYLNISEDGKYLVAINADTQLNIISLDSNEIQRYNSNVNFTKANTTPKDDDYLVHVLGNDNYIYTYSINKRRQVSKEPFKNQEKFKTFDTNYTKKILTNKFIEISAVTMKQNKIYLKINNEKLLKEFDLKTLKLSTTNEEINFSDDENSTIKIKYNSEKVLEVYKNNKFLFVLDFKFTKTRGYIIIDDKYIVVTTDDITATYIFNLEGRAIAKLSGFLSYQDNMIYEDNYLISYGKDNIVHIWNLSNLDIINKREKSYDEDVLMGYQKTFGGNPLDMLNEDLDDSFLELFKKQNKLSFKPTQKQIKSLFSMLVSKKEIIYPLASLYLKDNEWILYDQKGLFTSSKQGQSLIKYHLNQGLHKEAKIIENRQIFEKFYRPDLLQKKLAKQKIDFDIDVKSIILNTKAPEIDIIDAILKDKKNLDLIYKICDAGSGISNTSLVLNGIFTRLQDTRGFVIKPIIPKEDNCTTYKNTITLKSGINKISIQAFDKEKLISNDSKTITIETKYTVAKKSNLHLVSIAVSKYRDTSLNLKYAVSDVIAIKNKIKIKSKALFENIYTYDLHDANVSIEKLDVLFDKISKNTALNDVFIMYIAGHGVTSIKDGLYYFLPHNITDTSSDGLKKNAISINDIKNQLGKIKANKSLILLDTCDSGSAIESLSSRGLEQRMALERLSYATGRNYIVASSKNQAALEGYKNHGVFTYTVLDAFDKAYFGNNQTLTVTSLASFVEQEVPKITLEKFLYEQFPQKYLNGNDFPIGMK